MSTTILGDTITATNINIGGIGTAQTTSVNDNSNNIATTSFVNSKISPLTIPTGIIVMWSGLQSTVPSGWIICDGNNGIPNLQGRFILGYSSASYGIGQIGGQTQVTLSTAEIPAHSHQMQQAGMHYHNFQSSYYSKMGELQEFLNGHENENFNEGSVGGAFSQQQGDWRYQGTLEMVEAGDHTHTIQNTGASGSHENMPPYYVLAYIMKT